MDFRQVTISVNDEIVINGSKKTIVSISKKYIQKQKSDNTTSFYFVNSITTN